MRRIISVMFVMLMLAGCGSGKQLPDKVMTFRDKLLKCNGCTFSVAVTADYGDRSYTFSMDCQMEKDGNIRFCVTEPETISGISGTLSEGGGGLTFDDQVLAFELLADGQITPVSAPWHMIEALRSGYLHSCSELDNGILLRINDSYMGENLLSEIRLDSSFMPQSCELFWQGRRFLTLSVNQFAFL